MLLNIENLSKHYGGVIALDDVTLSIYQGEIIGLVGDNGAGKSTLMKCVTGSESYSKGKISFDDHQLPCGSPHESRSRGIEMIYQNLSLCLQQDVTSNIFLGREPALNMFGVRTPFLNLRQMKDKAASIIESLNTDIDVTKKVYELSGGQQQAVAIARSLLENPRLLIMDEPTAALGVKEVEKVLQLINSLKKQGIAVVLISHRLADIYAVADRVVLMSHGKIIEDKASSQISIQSLTQRMLGGLK